MVFYTNMHFYISSHYWKIKTTFYVKEHNVYFKQPEMENLVTVSGLFRQHDREVIVIWAVMNDLGCEEKCHNSIYYKI